MPTETITLRLVAQDLASGNISKAIGGIDRMAQRGGIAGSVFQGVGLSIGMMLNPLTLAARGMSIASDAIGGAVNAAADFDDAMTKSTAIMGDLSDALRKDLEDAAKDAAKASRFSAKEAADAFFFLASAGLDATESIEALPRVTKFATAGAFDLATATDLLTDAQSALGLTTDDTAQNMINMTRVSDVLVGANTLANASVEQFSTALTSKAGAALKAFGISMEDGVAILAAFADQGVKAEEAGNALDRILRLLPDIALKNADAFRKFNIEVFDSAGEIRFLGDIVADMEAAFEGMSDAQLQAALQTLGFQARVQGVIKPLLGASDKAKEYRDELYRMGGVTEDVADKQLESFRAKMDRLNSQMETVGITVGSALIDPFGAFADTLVVDVIPAVERFVSSALAFDPDLRLYDEFNRAWDKIGEGASGASQEFQETREKWLAYVFAVKDNDAVQQQIEEAGGLTNALKALTEQERYVIAYTKAYNDRFGEGAEVTEDFTEDVNWAAVALKRLKENIDDYSDVRPLNQLEKAMQRQRKAIREALEENNYAKWAKHSAHLAELQDEAKRSAFVKKAFKEEQRIREERRAARQEEAAEEQRIQRRRERTVEALAETYNVSEKKVARIMERHNADLEKTTAALIRVKDKTKEGRDELEKLDKTKAKPEVQLVGGDATLTRLAEIYARLIAISGKQVFARVTSIFDGGDGGGGGGTKRPHTGGFVKAGETAIIRQNEAVLTPASGTFIQPLDGPFARNSMGGGGNVTNVFDFTGAFFLDSEAAARQAMDKLGPHVVRWMERN